jgi:hypothetical protein
MYGLSRLDHVLNESMLNSVYISYVRKLGYHLLNTAQVVCDRILIAFAQSHVYRATCFSMI